MVAIGVDRRWKLVACAEDAFYYERPENGRWLLAYRVCGDTRYHRTGKPEGYADKIEAQQAASNYATP